MHRPIFLKKISLLFSNKNCFENFSTTLYPGSHIAIIGKNGSGKSGLLNIICQNILPSQGTIIMPGDVNSGYVAQIPQDIDNVSGGQNFHKRLSEALGQSPNLLLLDEPTNHLDRGNRKSLIYMLKKYQGTLIIVSHDKTFIDECTSILWHIDHLKVHEFIGSYDDYRREFEKKRAFIQKELIALKRNKKETHTILMKEQKRAASSKAKGKKNIAQKKWSPVIEKSKAFQAEKTAGKKKSPINQKKQHLTDKLSDLALPKII